MVVQAIPSVSFAAGTSRSTRAIAEIRVGEMATPATSRAAPAAISPPTPCTVEATSRMGIMLSAIITTPTKKRVDSGLLGLSVP